MASWPQEGAMYITMVNFWGASQKKKIMQFFQNIDVSDKTIHKAFRTHTTL